MEKDLKKIRYYYHTLVEQKKVLDETKPLDVHHSTVRVIEYTFDEIEEIFQV